LVEGCFLPQAVVTKAEVKVMLEDAAAILEKTIIDESHENTYEFAEGVIVLPDGTEVTEDEDGVVHITDCPESILAGDQFAAYFNGIPVVYKAESVTVENNITSIATSAVATEDGFVAMDAQGVLGTDAMEIIPAEGVEVRVEESSSGASTYAVKKTKNLIGEIPLSFGGITGKASIKILNPYIDWTVTTERAYVALCGEAEITYGLYGNALEPVGLKKGFTVFTVSIAGVGSFDVNMDLIAGLPRDTVGGFEESLRQVIGLRPENITVHTLALKKGSRLMTEGGQLPTPEAVAEMLELAWSALRQAGYVPYYLYRQKYMSGGFENVSWCLPGKVNEYNIIMMEELHSVLSLGGGGMTKLVDRAEGAIRRINNPKYPKEYIERIEQVCSEKRSME